MEIGEFLPRISGRLPGDSPDLDAQVLLGNIIGKSRTWIAAHPDTALLDSQIGSIDDAVIRIQKGEPLPYVLGHWEFFGLDFKITPDVLIPRPETEMIVEQAILWLQSRQAANQVRLRAADVGTGSGCIAIALAHHIQNLHVLATDLSLPALKIARQNASMHNVLDRMDFVQSDLLPPHPSPLLREDHFDVICANLPYIPTKILHDLQIYGHEPTMALDGGEDGLNLIRRLLKIAPEWLAPNGLILLEIEAGQGLKAISLAYDSFDRATINLRRDLAGNERMVVIKPG